MADPTTDPIGDPNEENAPTKHPETPLNEQSEMIKDSPPKKGVLHGALGNALMRTFRGDINAKAGNKAKALVKRYVPNEGKPTALRGSVTHTLGADEKGRKETIVRTYKQDVQHQVRNKGVSMTRMAALESDRTEKDSGTKKQEPWKTTTLLLIGALFIVIGVVVAFGAYFAYQSRQVQLPPIDAAPSMIFTEARERIDITDRQPRNILQQLALARRNLFFSLGSVVEFYPTRFVLNEEEQKIPVPVGAAEFLASIDAEVSDVFLQTLGQEYMLGVHVIDENVPFLILTSSSYGHTFNGFFSWEKTIETDLSPFFNPSLEQTLPAIAEDDNEFVDTVIQNLDVRILRDEDRNIRIMYAFIDRATVVVTTNIRTLIELASRLQVQS